MRDDGSRLRDITASEYQEASQHADGLGWRQEEGPGRGCDRDKKEGSMAPGHSAAFRRSGQRFAFEPLSL